MVPFAPRELRPLIPLVLWIEFLLELVTRSLVHRFDTLSLIPVSFNFETPLFLGSDIIQEIKSDVLIAHAG
jgi:hypothetical protein